MWEIFIWFGINKKSGKVSKVNHLISFESSSAAVVFSSNLHFPHCIITSHLFATFNQENVKMMSRDDEDENLRFRIALHALDNRNVFGTMSKIYLISCSRFLDTNVLMRKCAQKFSIYDVVLPWIMLNVISLTRRRTIVRRSWRNHRIVDCCWFIVCT